MSDVAQAADRATPNPRKRRKRILRIVVGLWLLAIVVALIFQARSALTSFDGNKLNEYRDLLRTWTAAISPTTLLAILAGIYVVRPLIFFPSSVMGIACGFFFGPVTGTVLTLAGELVGANVAFTVGRFLGRQAVADHPNDPAASEQKPITQGTPAIRPAVSKKPVREFLKRWNHRLSEHGFATTTLVRLILLPFDMVSYACGVTRMRRWEFTLGTLVGGFPGFAVFSLIGGSQSPDMTGSVQIGGIDWSYRFLLVAIAIVLFVSGLLIGTVLRRQQINKQADANGQPALA